MKSMMWVLKFQNKDILITLKLFPTLPNLLINKIKNAKQNKVPYCYP